MLKNHDALEHYPGQTGRLIATIGVTLITLSMFLVIMLGISGAVLHNTLQLGGLSLTLIGLVMWLILKI